MANDNSLEILVRLGVIGQNDVKAVNDLLRESGTATEKAGESAEMSHRSFRRLAHTLGSEIPGAAALMEAGFEGAEDKMMGATFLLIGGLELLRKSIEKITEAEKETKQIDDELLEISAQRSQAAEKVEAAMASANVAEQVFHHNLLRDTRDSIAETAKLGSELLKLSTQGSESGLGERNKIAIAQIEEMEQRGVISHQTAILAKQQMDQEAHRQKVLLMLAEEQVQKQMDEAQLKARGDQGKKLATEESAAFDRYKQTLAAKTKNETQLEEGEAQIEKGKDIKKELAGKGVDDLTVEALKQVYQGVTYDKSGKLSGAEMWSKLHDVSTSDSASSHHLALALNDNPDLRKLFNDTQGDARLSEYDSAQNLITGGQTLKKSALQKREDMALAEAESKDDLDSKRELSKKNREQIQALQEKIHMDAATGQIKDRGALGELGLESASTAWNQAKGTADNLLAGHGATTDQQQQLLDLARKIAGPGVRVDLSDAIKVFEHGAENFSAFHEQIGRLAKAFSNWSPADLRQLKQDVDYIKSQMATAPL